MSRILAITAQFLICIFKNTTQLGNDGQASGCVAGLAEPVSAQQTVRAELRLS